MDIETFVRGLPKTDLHMHLEGSIEPELMIALAGRNSIPLRWDTADALRQAYQFDNLQSFLELYFEGCRVLVTQADFYDVTWAYLNRAHADGVVHAEMFIGPQSFTERDVPIEALLNGVLKAISDAQSAYGISAGLLISVHRHRSEAEAIAVLDQIEPWQNHVVGIGMGGAERGNPPSRFANFYQMARERGLRTCVHAGEEGPAAYVREAIEVLAVDRIDHGNACLDDPDLVVDLADRGIPLTVCPLSNLRLNVVTDMKWHPLRAMIDAGLNVTVNSDDPPYFGGYVTENLLACHEALDLSIEDIILLVRNGINAAFIAPGERSRLLAKLTNYAGAAVR
ncbi:adenosine deaminase [Novosphingobium fluoreni]|uniref:adenosine deaminase n=1 Tax=Novosphingobium fluoreni TaxID=1391222 RepID=UPI003DA1359F